MSTSDSQSTLAPTTDSRDTCFFLKFQNDVQVVFNEISSLKSTAHVAVNIMKGSIYLKGDYFIPLKSIETFQLNCQELLQRLKEISSVLSVDVDANYNLIFCLKRAMVYKTALLEVTKCSHQYAMTETKKSVLVLIDDDQTRSFDYMRNCLIAEHIISILSNNGVKVYYNKFKSNSKISHKNCESIICTDNCSLNEICKQLEQKANISQWKSDSEVNDNVCMDAKKYIEYNSLVEKYGNAINGIIVSKDNTHEDLRRTGFIKHLLDEHLNETPNFILHIAPQGQNQNVYKSGILLGMLEKLTSTQLYIFSQSVKCKDEAGASADDFMLAYKLEIERAMAHKYDSYNPDDKTWKSRIEFLVDTAVKFDFLKKNYSNILNLKAPSSQNGQKNFGIFVQYNFARLSNLFRNFETKVEDGCYSPLQPIEEVDFGLLKLEEEWNLFHYVLTLPKLVQTTVELLLLEDNVKNRCRLNKICLMLQELCQYWSLYYSRIRILSGPQPHLQKTMNARLWLLKGIHRVFQNSFLLLNVQGLDQM